MSDKMKLIGFGGEWIGDESSMVAHMPVFRHQRKLYVALKPNWSLNDGVRLVGKDEVEYIQRLPGRPDLRQGDIVWLAGPLLVSSCENNPLLKADLRDRFVSWPKFRQGFFFQQGTVRSFQELATTIYRVSKARLMRAVFDVAFNREILDKDIRGCFEVFISSGAFNDKRDHATTCGLYYFEQRQQDRYQRICDLAVDRGVFESADEFRRAVQKMGEAYRARRFSEDGPLLFGTLYQARFAWDVGAAGQGYDHMETVELEVQFIETGDDGFCAPTVVPQRGTLSYPVPRFKRLVPSEVRLLGVPTDTVDHEARSTVEMVSTHG